ncbi:hypothetical protein NA78x_005086 [Anatilimnocola sp. NA78]|uniref:hypothetical protein n=1 Tax=Anatilimnocola sp. NA78 TaxID=3415683 RepID=UPI003CE46A8B
MPLTPEFLDIVKSGNETAIDKAFFEGHYPEVFHVDWKEDDADIVSYCAESLRLDDLSAVWNEDQDVLTVIYRGKENVVPLQLHGGDRYITICTLNKLLEPDYEIRYMVCSHGSDTGGFVALSNSEWQQLEAANAVVAAENFINPGWLPDIFMDLTDDHLPPAALARHKRMVNRHR